MSKSLFLLLMMTCSIQRLQSQIDPELADVYQLTLDLDRDDNEYNGITAAVIYPDGCLWSGASGSSTGEDTINTETLFEIGLGTQIFTATLILLLQEEGSLDIEDSIGSHLPTIENVDSNITIHQLLNHTSGLANTLSRNNIAIFFKDEPDKFWEPDSVLEQFLGPPISKPGEIFSHSHANYILLAKVIEQVTGNPFHVELRARILDPLNLEHTFLLPFENVSGYLAFGKSPVTGMIFTDSTTAIYSAAFASIGLRSTPTDILVYFKSLFDGEIISSESLTMLTDTININGLFGEWQGHGLGIGFSEFSVPYFGQTGFGLHRARTYYSPTFEIGIVTIVTPRAQTNAFFKLEGIVLETIDDCMITDISDHKIDDPLIVFPNPAHEIVNVQVGDEFGLFDLRLFNSLGQELVSIRDLKSSYQIDLSDVGTGQLFIRIDWHKSSNVPITKKLIVN